MADYAFEGIFNGNEHNRSFDTLDEAQSYGEAAKSDPTCTYFKISLANAQGYTHLTGWARPDDAPTGRLPRRPRRRS